jgi:trimethylamine:corrinoid methyltransferase-like protein
MITETWPFSQAQLEEVHGAITRVLEKTGVAIEHEGVLRRLASG